jgi:hypothetical protein
LLLIASTYPYGYIYGPPLVASDLTSTQASVVGDGNLETTGSAVGNRPTVPQRAWPR